MNRWGKVCWWEAAIGKYHGMDTESVLTRARGLLRPFDEFVHQESIGGLLLLFSAAAALIWANSAASSTYDAFWNTPIAIRFGEWQLEKSARHWVNDGLMAGFFFVVGLEIKREVLVGELNSPRRAALPLAAAAGGMLFPAFAFVIFNFGRESAVGWGIPMATDIAFALGILALLGNRAGNSIKLFLTAVAIIDDIGAVLVIALFYTSKLLWTGLAISGLFLALLVLSNRAGFRHPLIYAVFGIGVWFGVLTSGVHATIAGVLVALTIPARPSFRAREFIALGRAILDRIEHGLTAENAPPSSSDLSANLQTLENASQRMESPLQRLEHSLHPWVSYAIMPLFALANAGVSFGGELELSFRHPVAYGVIAGLVIGKPVGVLAATWLFVRAGGGGLPAGVSWRDLLGIGMLAGIGFTMSLFIADLAFQGSDLLSIAKLGVMAASLLAGVLGWLVLRRRRPENADMYA